MHGAHGKHHDEEDRQDDHERAHLAIAGQVLIVHFEVLILLTGDTQAYGLLLEKVVAILRDDLIDARFCAIALVPRFVEGDPDCEIVGDA